MSRLLLSTSWLLILALPASSEPPTKAKPAEVERLIRQLDSERFSERQAASKALKDIGEPALEALRKASSTKDDAEVRRRAQDLVRAIERREWRCFVGHTGVVHGVTFSPDGKRVLSGSGDETLRLWDVETGQQVRCLKGHTGCVNSVAFSPDGKRALSGSADRTVRLWQLPK